MKKILSLSLVLLLIFGSVFALPASAEPDGINLGDYWFYTQDDGTAIISGYEGTEDVITVPSEIAGCTVTGIGYRAFAKCKATEIILPDTLTFIDVSAFRLMTNLKNIVIPDSVTSIGRFAFEYCTSLENITLPPNLTHIGQQVLDHTLYYETAENWDNLLLYCGEYLVSCDKTFSGVCVIKEGTTLIAESTFAYIKTIESFELPEGLKYIGYSCFFGNPLIEQITIPDSVISIDEVAFSHCTSLNSINLPENIEHIGQGILNETIIFNTPENWKNGGLYIDGILVAVEPEYSSTFTIEEGTRTISSSAFQGISGIKSITMPHSVTSIGKSAFAWCFDLEYIRLSKNLTEIPEGAFMYCSTLKNISIPKNITTIGDYAFEGCYGIETFTIPETVTEIGFKAIGYDIEDKYEPFVIYGKPDTAAEDYALTNGFKFENITPKYKDKVLELLDIPEEDPEDGRGWLDFYREDYKYFSSTADSATPDFVLIETYTNEVGPAFAATIIGDYVLRDNNHHFPYTFGYFIYLPKTNEIYTLEEAVNRGIEGAYSVFTEGGIGELLGDVNYDRKLNIKDATLIQKDLAEIDAIENNEIEGFMWDDKENTPTYIGDFNRDKKMNVRDATAIQKYIAGMASDNLTFTILDNYVVDTSTADEIKVIARNKNQLEEILKRVSPDATIDETLNDDYFKEKAVVVIADKVTKPQVVFKVEQQKNTLIISRYVDNHVDTTYYQCLLIEIDKQSVVTVSEIKTENTEALICF